MVESTHFTCIGRSHGAPATPSTKEDWEKMRREQWLADMCRRIAAGDEKLKGKLPIWTPGCAEFAGNHRAIKDALRPLPRLMLDFDEKGHSKEILERSMELMKAGKWEILLVEESVRKGTHVLITLPDGMSPQEAQNRFSHDVGFQADPALKDIARCIYMVPEEYTLFVSDALFSPQSTQSSTEFSNQVIPHAVIQSEGEDEGGDVLLSEAKNLEGTKVDVHVDVPEILRRDAPLDDKVKINIEKEKNSVELRVLSGENQNYPQTHEDIPYEQIIEVLEEQMGGRPDIGSRNNFIFSMACHLRYICDDNPAWIAQVLPTYGEEWPKFEATVRSACNRIQTKTMPRIIKRTLAICKQRFDSEIINQKSKILLNCPMYFRHSSSCS